MHLPRNLLRTETGETMTRWTWAYGFAGVAALLIACGDQDVPSGPTAVSTESPTAALAPARPTPNTTLKATPTASLRPTPSPSSTPTPTPTARESAALHLAEQELAMRVLGYPWVAADVLGRDE